MSEQTNNSAGGTTEQQAQTPLDDLGKLLKFLTNPAVASAAASIGLYFAINPREIKKSLENIQDRMDELLSLTKKQSARINTLEQLLLEQSDDDLDDEQDKDDPRRSAGMRQYRKVGKRSSAYLD